MTTNEDRSEIDKKRLERLRGLNTNRPETQDEMAVATLEALEKIALALTKIEETTQRMADKIH